MTTTPGAITQCFVPPLASPHVSSSTPVPSTRIALPVVESDDSAAADLADYLEHVRSGGDPAEAPEAWLLALENGKPRNCRWPAVLGTEKNRHVEVARIYRKLREELIEEKSDLGSIQANEDFITFAEVLYRNIPPEYEYVASLKEFWVLLAVYVVPDWIWSCYETPDAPMSAGAQGARFLLKRGLVRDALARHWWKYHVLRETLGRDPSSVEYGKTSPSKWQERTRMYSYPEVVKQTATTKVANSILNDLAKTVGKDLCVYDATPAVLAESLESSGKPRTET